MIYAKNKLKEISFPLGGMGSGSIGLAGNGCLVDWEIFNRPNKCSINGYSFFAIKAEYPNKKSVTKILQGDWTKDFTGYGPEFEYGYGHGLRRERMCGFPHFKKVKFDGKFPIAKITFEDDDFPAKVTLEAFNPFIPLDADNSSIPAAFFEIKVQSREENVKYTVVLSVTNPFQTSLNKRVETDSYTAVQMIYGGKTPNDKGYGDITACVDCGGGICQEYWYRGGWQDSVSTFWYDITRGTLHDRKYQTTGKKDVCTVGAEKSIGKNKSDKFRFIISWNVPNNFNYWNRCLDKSGNDVTWKNYYATLFKDSVESAEYSLNNWDELYKKTLLFCKALHSATLDGAIKDAISSTLSVLKSATVFRLSDGSFYGFEGVNLNTGSCEGSCTHVWSYAYALCFLFPELEKSMRDIEFAFDTDADGRMYFRTALPLKRGHVDEPPCVDGQAATVIKIYRDWKLTGNTDWLKKNWNNVKLILEYCWSEKNFFEWDKDKDGVLEGCQHHTLDTELFGPSAWLEGMYLAALKAAAEMADFLGDIDKKKEYYALYEKGYNWTKENLFNGSYFYQNVDLKRKDYTERFKFPQYWNEESGQLKYQIADGCEIDQLLGQWHANICGLGDIFDSKQRKIALKNMFRNNFKENMRNVANAWRVFALNDESGTVICDYPDEKAKPVIPIGYCEECMTGFEYAFAGLLASEGMIDECVKIVRAVRKRYDGENRNPWNEIECGSNYARAMASFALLPIFSGFEFDLPKKHIGFLPIVEGDFRCFWAVGTAWGNFIKTNKECLIEIALGTLEIESLSLPNGSDVKAVYVDGKNLSFVKKDNKIVFNLVKIKKQIRCVY